MLVLLIISFLLIPSAWAKDPPQGPAPLPVLESINIYNFSHPGGKPRSSFTMAFRTVTRNSQIFYEVTAVGKGAFDKYSHAEWTVTSQLVPEGKFIKPLWTQAEIKDFDGKKTIWLETRFDYDKKKIIMTARDSKETTTKNFVYPIKGLTVDYASLHYFLKPFLAEEMRKKDQSFYFLTIEPALYKVNLRFEKNEKLNFPSGPTTALKLRLIPDFGVLSNILDKLVPPTYLWYENQPPYHWLKYQGLETGLHSPHIAAYLGEPEQK